MVAWNASGTLEVAEATEGNEAEMKFEASTNGVDKFALTDALQWFADDFWLPDHATPEQAAGIILDSFKRKVEGQLELLELKPNKIEGRL